MSDGQQRTATLVGADYPFTDLAVIKIDGDKFPAAQLGESERLVPGQMVVAIGSALGDLRNSVTRGIVSGLHRTLPGEDVNLEDLIQTDAAINHGNSGGPLVNAAGLVVGINTAIIRSTPSTEQAEGIGFAIPSDTVRLVTDEVIRFGRVLRPFLGVSHRTISPALASAYGLPVRDGIYILTVQANTPASRAGIHERDIIVSIADDVIDGEHPFLNLLMRHKPGDRVSIKLNRAGQELTVDAVLAERSPR